MVFQKINDEDITTIDYAFSNNCNLSARDIQLLLLVKNNTEVSLSSVRKAIDAASWVSTAPRYCQLKRDANKEARVKFCQDMIQNNDNFQDVIFSDETTLQLHDNKTGAYRRKESAAPTNCRPKHPLKVNVWGGTSKRCATQILIS